MDGPVCGSANEAAIASTLLQRFVGPAMTDHHPGRWNSQEHWAQTLLAQAARIGQLSTTVTTTGGAARNAAAVEGVHANQAGDLDTFLFSLATNCGIVVVAIFVLSLLRYFLPAVYRRDSNLRNVSVDKRPEPERGLTVQGRFGWLSESWNASAEEVADIAGLDAGMHCEFLALGMRLSLCVAVPCVLVLCPLHMLVGGDAAGDDRLSKVGMANVQHGSWLCWLHALFVWYVVLITHAQVHLAQRRFMPLRVRWLQKSPLPTATSILVQGIPDHLLTVDALRRFFDEGVFGCQAVKRIEFVKDTSELLYWQRVADAGQGTWRTGTGRVLEGQELQAVAASMVDKYRKQLLRSNDQNSPNAFVTFQHHREAVVAQKLLAEEDYDGIRADAAPDPGEVLWRDLALDQGRQAIKELIGYFLIFLVFWGFMPLVVGIQSIANLHTLENHIHFFKVLVQDFPALATLWNGLMASFALSVAMSFLPSLLMIIITYFFMSKAEMERQHRLQVGWACCTFVDQFLLTIPENCTVLYTSRLFLGSVAVLRLC